MHNNTPDDYIEAIRIKYEKEKDEGIYSNYLSNPSQANLRDLCWKIYKSDVVKADDLSVYYDFFKFEFDPNNENTSINYTDKFKKVGAFLRREKQPAKIDTVNFAAILVDFELRPYPKFKKKSKIGDEKNDIPSDFEPLNLQEEQIKDSETFTDSVEKEVETEEIKPKSINLFINFKDNFLDKLKKNLKQTTIGVVIVFGLGFAISHYVFPKKQCMQWSNDHYEKVDCDLKTEGFVVANVVEPFDETKFGLKKITVSDTTTCFNKNGDAIIWYAKTVNGIDFFNTHGRHPENQNPLKPVTHYILDKYVK